jgi:hypothetical protein
MLFIMSYRLVIITIKGKCFFLCKLPDRRTTNFDVRGMVLDLQLVRILPYAASLTGTESLDLTTSLICKTV